MWSVFVKHMSVRVYGIDEYFNGIPMCGTVLTQISKYTFQDEMEFYSVAIPKQEF